MAIKLPMVAALPSAPREKNRSLARSFTLLPYETNYALISYTQPLNKAVLQGARRYANGLQPQEAKFQLSVAFILWDRRLKDNSHLGFSYTQRAWWQAFSPLISSPFRETNYEPQLFMAWRLQQPLCYGWHLKRLEMGLNHHSNGRAHRTSRSWNRLYARFLAHQGQWQIDLKPWLRLKEGEGDDNPDITRYLGYYQLRIAYHCSDRSGIYLKHHYHWRTGYGGYELGGHYPLSRTMRLYLQWFNGYGESLIDYNFRQSRLGIGLILAWMPSVDE